MLCKVIWGFGLSAALFGSSAQADGVRLSLDSKALGAKAETENGCAYKLAAQIKPVLFVDTASTTFHLAPGFKWRAGWDGWKYWFTVTEKSPGLQRDYFLNLRVRFGRAGAGAHSRGTFTGLCSLEKNATFPLYVTNANGVWVAWLPGRALGDAILDGIGNLMWPQPKPPSGGYGFFK